MSAPPAPAVLVSSYYYPSPTNPERWFHAAVPMAYVDSLRLAGGVPLVAPPLDDDEGVRSALERCQAVLIVGGPDLDPAAYGQEPHPATKPLHGRRNDSDLRLAGAALRSGKPLLGICGGMQVVNVVLGGDLHQHIPDAIEGAPPVESSHRKPDDNFHMVRIEPHSRLAGILGAAELEVNSAHHQAVNRVGEGLKVAARSAAGIIEALECTEAGRFLVLVQWHPERLAVDPPKGDRGARPAPGRPDQLAIFAAFVEAARK